MDGISSKLVTYFSMISSLSSNTMYGVRWYMDSGASKHMAFGKLQEYEASILDDYFKYATTRMGFISLQIPLGDIFELNGVLHVLGLTKNFLSVLVMINV